MDYTLVLAESAESGVTELTAARRMMATVDGLILASPRMDDDDIRTIARDKPVVVINREVDGVPCVVPDVNKGISEAVRSLAANGHHKVAFAGAAAVLDVRRRWEACRPPANGPARRPRAGIQQARSSTAAASGARRPASGATAVLTYNDLLAIGLMQELQAAGMVVPDQISIVGFDDIFGADFHHSSAHHRALAAGGVRLRRCHAAA